MLQDLFCIISNQLLGEKSCENSEKIMKAERKRKISLFNWGHAPHNKGIKVKSEEQNDNQPTQYVRLTQAELGIVGNNPILPPENPSGGMSDISRESFRILRPKPASQLEVEKKNFGAKNSRCVHSKSACMHVSLHVYSFSMSEI